MEKDKWIREIRPVGKDRFLVVCESDEPFVLYRREIQEYGIEENKVCTAETYALICREILKERAKNRCMYLLEKQDYTEAQIRQKLKDGYYPDEITDSTVSWLKDLHAIDDRRYAETYLRTNHCRYSRRILEQKLMQRGIGKETIEEILEADSSIAPDEREQIASLLMKKSYDPSAASAKEREKVRQMLTRKGYSLSLIREMT